MFFPFKKKESQKKFGIICTLVGILIMIIGSNFYVFNIINGFYIGILLATLGLIYFLEVLS